jgi:hypothetical protein
VHCASKVDGATTRRAVRYFLQWIRGRGLAGDLAVPLSPRQEPAWLLAESDHIQQLDRWLTDETMPLDLRVGGALVLLFGMLVSRITQLTKDDVIEDGQAAYLAIAGTTLRCRHGCRVWSSICVTTMNSIGHSPA